MLAKYYERMDTPRMAEILELSEEVKIFCFKLVSIDSVQDSEQHLSNLVSNQTVHAKVNRPAKVVVFSQKPTSNSVLNDWNHSLRF